MLRLKPEWKGNPSEHFRCDNGFNFLFPQACLVHMGLESRYEHRSLLDLLKLGELQLGFFFDPSVQVHLLKWLGTCQQIKTKQNIGIIFPSKLHVVNAISLPHPTLNSVFFDLSIFLLLLGFPSLQADGLATANFQSTPPPPPPKSKPYENSNSRNSSEVGKLERTLELSQLLLGWCYLKLV